MSSPGGSTGRFYERCTKPHKNARVHVATAYDCPHQSKKEIDEYIERNGGKENALVRSSIFAEFTDAFGSEYVIPSRLIEFLFNNPTAHRPGDLYAFVDWSAGGDETVVAIRNGNKLTNLICWKDKDTMRSVGRCVSELRKYGLVSSNVWADDGGLGRVMNDAMRDLGFPVNRALNNKAASNPDHYKNIIAEKWLKFRQAVEKCEVILIKDDVLIKQLCNRKQGEFKADGKFCLESKEDMRNRGVGSPDRADAVIGVFTVGKNYLTNPKSMLNYYQQDVFDEENIAQGHEGFHAG
jgi:hypothetical protein